MNKEQLDELLERVLTAFLDIADATYAPDMSASYIRNRAHEGHFETAVNLRDAILAAQADEVETAACQCRDGGGGTTDMRDCPRHLREYFGVEPEGDTE